MQPFTLPHARRARAATAGALLSLGCVACGGDGETTPAPDGPPPGFWFAARPRPEVDLGHLGYAAGTRPADASALRGAALDVPEKSAPGLNLYCSGHAPEAHLVTAEGERVHTWAVDYAALVGVPPLLHSTQRAWRRVRLMPDGGLLALHEALVLLRLDVDSNLVWSVALGAHHDFDIDGDGNVHLLVRSALEHPAIAQGRTVVDDGVAVLSPAGEVLRRSSFLVELVSSPWAHLVDDAAQIPGGREIDAGEGLARDLLHVNSYTLLGAVPAGLPEAFQRGRALVCLRELDAVALFDPAEGRFVWLLQGALDGPHDPELDAEGRLWVFDNGLRRGWSRAVAFDPATGREVASWPKEPDPAFHSEVCGALQILPGGNLLLTESTAGRAFEVTRAGEVVWRFGTPHRVEGRRPDGASEPLVACLFEVERLPWEGLPARFAGGAPAASSQR
jgi:hypothetical protein